MEISVVSRALVAERVFGDLHHQLLAFLQVMFDILRAFFGQLLAAEIGQMQKGGLVQANIDKGRLHARQYPAHLAFINVADQALLANALDDQFLQHAVFDDGDPGSGGVTLIKISSLIE